MVVRPATSARPGDLDEPATDSLIDGMAAAPEPRDGHAALASLVPSLPHEQAATWLARARERRAAYAATVAGGPAPGERLDDLRAELAVRGLEGYLVPLSDEHHGEYVPIRARRLAWLSGFTGTAGMAVVLAGKAALFSDGRYTLQAEQQVDDTRFARLHLTNDPPHEWLAENLPAGGKVGYDPWLHTLQEVERFRTACEQAGGALEACGDNPIDAVWHDRPPPPLSPVVAHDLIHAGESAVDKRTRLAEALAKKKVDAAVLTDPSSIAWLLNIRGRDVEHTPLPLSFAILRRDATVQLFVDSRKLTPGLREHLGDAVTTRPPEALAGALDTLGREGRKVEVDAASAGVWFLDRLDKAGAKVVRGKDPCALPRAFKNEVELAGARTAHVRDGAALTRFLAWLDRHAATGSVDEIAAAERLGALRAEDPLFHDLSFNTISGAGPNGAIVHYRVTPESNRRLEPGTLYLVDSGAQYLDGTTDVTRTVAVGTPSDEHRARFTAVLKGHTAIATARFPDGVSGSQLDGLARHALWRLGLDYDHGTGHGVGSYLGVHEGPHRISKMTSAVALKPGMIVSNEPGYYKTGAYGIRIENLVTVVACEAPEGAEKPLYGFETLTQAPIDRNLVEPSLLTGDEIAWLDAYHAGVRKALAPRLDDATRAWLDEATRPLGARA